VEIVERVVAAVNDRDVEGYLACCTEDVQLCTPVIGGVYDGPAGIRRFFTDVADAAPEFHLMVDRLEPIGADRVLAFLHLTARGRVSGISTPMDTANVYDLVKGKIARTRIFLDRADALKAVGLSE
jgi:hypothetical protein